MKWEKIGKCKRKRVVKFRKDKRYQQMIYHINTVFVEATKAFKNFQEEIGSPYIYIKGNMAAIHSTWY